MKKQTVTEQVYDIVFDILEKNPDGIQWTELNKQVEEIDPGLHPKTINGCVWKLVERYPDKVYKPEKGKFKLIKNK